MIPEMAVKRPNTPNASGAKSLERIGAANTPIVCAMMVPVESVTTFDTKVDIDFNDVFSVHLSAIWILLNYN